jgi:FkbM family methyltransferase
VTDVLLRTLQLMRTRGAFGAMIRWPKFSLASFSIVQRMIRCGVLPHTVIDVGANVGQFSVAVDRLYPEATVYPVEPDPRTAARLKANVGKRLAKNVRTTAVGDYVGTASFHVNSDTQVSSLLNLGKDRLESFPKSQVVESVTVPVTTLDAIFGADELASPILIKIDVQGFEDRVINGAKMLLERTKWVLMEVSFSSLYEGESDFTTILNIMHAHGFRFLRPMNFHISPVTGEIIEMDALFEKASAL